MKGIEVDLTNINVRRIILEGIQKFTLGDSNSDDDLEVIDEFLSVKVLVDVRIPRFDISGNRAVFILKDERGEDVFCVSHSNFDEVKEMLKMQGMKIDLVNFPDEIIQSVDWTKATNILKRRKKDDQ